MNGQVYFKDTHLQELLNIGHSQAPVEIPALMVVDRLEMTDHDRELIAYQCNDCKENQIVITHGREKGGAVCRNNTFSPALNHSTN